MVSKLGCFLGGGEIRKGRRGDYKKDSIGKKFLKQKLNRKEGLEKGVI